MVAVLLSVAVVLAVVLFMGLLGLAVGLQAVTLAGGNVRFYLRGRGYHWSINP